MSSDRRVLGIDPGVSGALALLDGDGDLIDVVDAPSLKDGPAGRAKISAALLAEIVRRWGPTEAFVEAVATRPGEGAVGAFAFGRSLGAVEGVLGACGVPTRSLTPQIWRRAAGLAVGKDKDASRSEAIRRWPAKAALFARKKDHGRAESALIAAAGIARAHTSLIAAE